MLRGEFFDGAQRIGAQPAADDQDQFHAAGGLVPVAEAFVKRFDALDFRQGQIRLPGFGNRPAQIDAGHFRMADPDIGARFVNGNGSGGKQTHQESALQGNKQAAEGHRQDGRHIALAVIPQDLQGIRHFDPSERLPRLGISFRMQLPTGRETLTKMQRR